MREDQGDIWEAYNSGFWIVIPTNKCVKKNGEAVMGRGLALQAKQRFPCLPLDLGQAIKDVGAYVYAFMRYRLIVFPVKNDWRANADLKLIEESCKQLLTVVNDDIHHAFFGPVYIPRVGCGYGQLDWKDVKPILEKYLDDRFIVIDYHYDLGES